MVSQLVLIETNQQIESFQQAAIRWFKEKGRVFPWRQTREPFKILVAEVLLKLTGAWKAESVYNRIVADYGVPERMAIANLEELRKAFEPLGLHGRASLLVEISKELQSHFNGEVPNTYLELVSLKGIGHYIANAILCLAYGERVPLVDGSVSRIFCRCLGFSTNKPAYADKELWDIAGRLLPESDFREYNLGLLDIGALLCKYRKPCCTECPLARLCVALSRGNNNSEAR